MLAKSKEEVEKKLAAAQQEINAAKSQLSSATSQQAQLRVCDSERCLDIFRPWSVVS